MLLAASPKALRVLCVVFLYTFFRIIFFPSSLLFLWAQKKNKEPSTNYCYFTWLVVLFHFSKNVSYRWIATLRRLKCNLFCLLLLVYSTSRAFFLLLLLLGKFYTKYIEFFFFHLFFNHFLTSSPMCSSLNSACVYMLLMLLCTYIRIDTMIGMIRCKCWAIIHQK